MTDIKDKPDTVACAPGQTTIERNKKILELKKMSNIKLSQSCVYLSSYATLFYYYCLDLRIEENKKWVCDLGKLCYEKDILIEIYEVQSLETVFNKMCGVRQNTMLRKLGSKQEVMILIEKGNENV